MLKTQNQVLAQLRAEVDAAGSQTAFAAANSISITYVSEVLAGRRDPGRKILAALGLTRVVLYRETPAKMSE